MLLWFVGLSDKEDWLEPNDRNLNFPMAQKMGVNPAAGKPPAPVVGPDLGPAESPDATMEPRGPNVLVLPKPLTKVRLTFDCFPETHVTGVHAPRSVSTCRKSFSQTKEAPPACVKTEMFQPLTLEKTQNSWFQRKEARRRRRKLSGELLVSPPAPNYSRL